MKCQAVVEKHVEDFFELKIHCKLEKARCSRVCKRNVKKSRWKKKSYGLAHA